MDETWYDMGSGTWHQSGLRLAATRWPGLTKLLLALLAASGQAGCVSLDAASPKLSASAQEYVVQFKEIDTEGSGKITIDQAIAHYTRRFVQLDVDRNHRLDSKELEPMLPVMGVTTGQELHSKLDNNGDGKLTVNEFNVMANWLFRKSRGGDVMTLDDAMAPPEMPRPPMTSPFEKGGGQGGGPGGGGPGGGGPGGSPGGR